MTRQQRADAKLAKIKRDEQIISLYSDGTFVRDIASMLSISQATIFRVLKSNNISLKYFRFTTATIQHAINLYNDSVNTIDSILEQTGIRSEQTLYRHLNDNNIPLRKSITNH